MGVFEGSLLGFAVTSLRKVAKSRVRIVKLRRCAFCANTLIGTQLCVSLFDTYDDCPS
jgi:hypothetical protein